MAQNHASANVMRKNGFHHLSYIVLEKWGYAKPIITEKWVRTRAGYHKDYHFHE
jgi:RimJ/RimL family protein N-acetyltransferase